MRRIAWQRSRAFCTVCGVAIHRRFSAIRLSMWGRHSCLPSRPRRRGRQECLPHRRRPEIVRAGRSWLAVRVGSRGTSSEVTPRRGMGRCSVADTTRKRGAGRPKNRSMSRSVTQSYLAPPMPWMNRSPRARRAQSVVISARGRMRTPPRCNSVN